MDELREQRRAARRAFREEMRERREGFAEHRHAFRALADAYHQVARFGTDDQRTSAVAVIEEARRELFRLLAEAPVETPADAVVADPAVADDAVTDSVPTDDAVAGSPVDPDTTI